MIEAPTIRTHSRNSTVIFSLVINTLALKGIYIEANDSMNLDDRTEQKLKRLKRRNFVAKNNKHRAKQHASLKQYTRRPKHQSSLLGSH
jgi:hypothetical protein